MRFFLASLRLFIGPLIALAIAGIQPTSAEIEELAENAVRVGDQLEGRIVVPTNQVLSPLGRQVAFSGRPTDVAVSPDGRWLAVLNRKEAIIVDVKTAEIISWARVMAWKISAHAA
jgi:hypothetical protein